MQELKMQNGLLLQLINSKNRQNQILFQQYEQLAADNSALRLQIQSLRARRDHTQQSLPTSPRDQELRQLRQQCTLHIQTIADLQTQIQQNGGTILLLESQLGQSRNKPAEDQPKLEQPRMNQQGQEEEREDESSKGRIVELQGLLQSETTRVGELEAVLKLKESAVTELTEYMNEQAARIIDLTREGIANIENYELKLQERGSALQQAVGLRAALEGRVEELETNIVKQRELAEQVVGERLQQMQALLSLKEQSIAELSEFMHAQTQKIAALEGTVDGTRVRELEAELAQMKEECGALRQIVASKQQSMAQLSEFLGVLTLKSQQFQLRQAQLEQSLRESELRGKLQSGQEFASMHSMKEAEEVDEGWVKLSTKQDELARIKQIVVDKEQTVLECQQRINQLTDRVKELELSRGQAIGGGEDSVLKGRVEELEGQLRGKEQTVAELSDYLNSQLGTITELGARVKQFEQRGSVSKAEEGGQGQILVFSQKIQQLQTILKSKEQSLAELTAYLEQNYIKLGKLQEDVERLSSQNLQLLASLQSQQPRSGQSALVQELQVRLRECEATVERKEEEVTRLSLLISAQGAADCSGGEELRAAREAVRDLQATVNAKSETIAELSEFMNDQAGRLAQLQEQLEQQEGKGERQDDVVVVSLKERVLGIEEMLMQKEAAIAELGELVQHKGGRVRQLEAELGRLQSEKEQFKAITPQKAQELQQMIANQGLIVVSLSQKLKDLQQREMEMQVELDSVRNQHGQLQGLNASLRKEMAVYEQVIENNRLEAAELTKIVQEGRQAKLPDSGDAQLRLQLQSLRDKIVDLQGVVQSKTDTIMQLSQFMNQQAARLEQLQTKHQDQIISQTQSASLRTLEQKVTDLQAIVGSKEQAISELTQYLQQNQVKIAELQQEVQRLLPAQQGQQEEGQKDQLGLELLRRQQEFQEKIAGFEGIVVQKKGLLMELQLAIDQKKMELQAYKGDILKMQANRSGLEQGKGQMVSEWQSLFLQKQEEANGLTELLQTLQEQLRGKTEIIQHLQQKIKTVSSAQNLQNPSKQVSCIEEQQRERISQLQQQLGNLRTQHKELTQRLDSLQQSSLLQAQYEMLGFDGVLEQQSKQFSASYRKELKQMRQQQLPQSPIPVQPNQQGLTASEILSQLMVYSESDTQDRQVRGLLIRLSQRYSGELQGYQLEIQGLRQEMGRVEEEVDRWEGEAGQWKREGQRLREEVSQLNKAIVEKNELIDQLQEMNQEKEQSFNQKLDGIRQSMNVFGEETPIILAKLLDGQQISHQKQDRVMLSKIRQQNKQLLEELQHLKAEITAKDAELQKIQASKQPTFERELDYLLRDSNSNIHGEQSPEDHPEQEQELQRLRAECQRLQGELQRVTCERAELQSRCADWESRVREAERQCRELAETIEWQNQRIASHTCERKGLGESSVLQHDSSRAGDLTGAGVLRELEEVPREEAESEGRSAHGQFVALCDQIADKNGVIAELEETILKLEKGYNAEIMDLRRGNAELNAQIINLRKRIYIANPAIVDVAELIKDTCNNDVQETAYFKPDYNMRYCGRYTQEADRQEVGHYGQEIGHNVSYLTEQQPRRSRGYRIYQVGTQLSLGQKMMGRRCREGSYLASNGINNQYRLNASGWQMLGRR